MLDGIDILAIISQDTELRRVAATHGGEYAGRCPFCGGTDRFRVWPEHPSGRGRWHCMGQRAGRAGCDRAGDVVDYLQLRHGYSFRETVKYLTQRSQVWVSAVVSETPMPFPKSPVLQKAHPPSSTWQEAARAFVGTCQVSLWSSQGLKALEWLKARGLSEETITEAGLGYNSIERWESASDWGREGKHGRQQIWLPRGIVIPWWIDEQLWRVNIRRPAGKPKYISPAGYATGLYNAGAVGSEKPVMMLEGEFDALTVKQVAGDLVTPVATGSTSGARRMQWIVQLALCSAVLVSFDAEQDKGDRASLYWLGILDNAFRWRPYWEDVNAMVQDGVDVRAWVSAGLTHCGAVQTPVV
jgi:DNA primase